ncbi:type IX secretion system membrane protein PorP/SprF [Flavobacterium sp.]|uniref:PorP/SprF family type IX secretion system membrane protein n=1 Tax=Flavobacterium sp. TaxID=239 RepID=UPI003B9CC25A
MNFKKRYLALLFLITQISFSQEGIPIYSDYLSDNYYLIHPSMAGAANCAKIRVTARQQWFGVEDAPALQTASFNGRLGEQSGGGIIVFNDKNGYHSQRGVKLTYAHHIMFSRSEVDLNQLSFGMNVGLIQSQLDETQFVDFDPVVGGVIQRDSYFNVDVGASYNYLDFYTHLTVKNLLTSSRDLYSDIESPNLRKLLFSAGYTFGDADRILWEPSVLFQLVDETQEKSIDFNLKAYRNVSFGQLWGALSYRRSFDSAQFEQNGSVNSQRLQYITPIVGVNYKQFMFAYTYSHLLGDIQFTNGGFHQITLGINLFCEREKFDCNCPAIN